MSKPLPEGMIEATRLTQAGRLGEATALIQRLLKGAWPGRQEAGNNRSLPTIDVVVEDVTSREGQPVAHTVPTASVEPVSRRVPRVAGSLRDVVERLRHAGGGRALHRALKKSPPRGDVAPSVGTFTTKMFRNDAGSRTYKLYVPSGYRGEQRPLIVMLHGCTQAPDDFAAGTRMNFAAEERNCFVVYPEQAATANASKCWNWFNSSDQQRGQGEPALIAGLTRQVMADHAIDPRRIYIVGLSAGGAAAAVIAEAYPDLYAAVGVHSGLACGVARDMPSALVAMQGRHPAPAARTLPEGGDSPAVPTIVFHGDRDTTVHPRNGAEVVARASAGTKLDLAVERGRVPAGHAYTRTVQRDDNGRGFIEEWVIHGGGHAWSGGSTSGSYTDPKGPDATREMLRFFFEHKRHG